MTGKPLISVVITAHNAENSIRECLLSIAANNGFAPGEVEIILVDDRSRDKTTAVARGLGLDNLTILSITQPSAANEPTPPLSAPLRRRGRFQLLQSFQRSTNTFPSPGGMDAKRTGWVRIFAKRQDFHRDKNPELTTRQKALDAGFRRARGEVILITDTDALVPENWIYTMASPLMLCQPSPAGLPPAARGAFLKNRPPGPPKKRLITTHSRYDTALSAEGIAGTIEFRGKKKWLAKLQTVDALSYFFLSRLFNRLGINGGIFFGNFAFKKEVYEKIGGFAAIGFALTEDLSFYRAMRAKGLNVQFSAAAPVSVRAAGSWRDLIRRNRRVSSGGFSFLSLFLGMWLISLIVLFVLAAGTSPAIKILSGVRYLFGAGFAAYAIIKSRRFSLLPTALIYEASVIILGILTLFSLLVKRKIVWGGVVYDR